MAKKQAAPEAQASTEDAIEKLLGDARKVLTALQASSRLNALRPDGTCPVFYADEVFHIALPWSDVDGLQMQMLARRTAPDDVLMQQIFDLVPTLAGRTLIDVGSFTGTSALMMQRFLKPDAVHMFEPQQAMQEALATTLGANPDTSNITVHQTVIDEEGAQITRSASRPDRFSEASYLRREGGAITARSIDSFGFENVGLISMDFNNTKLNALKGAQETIARDRPVVVMDLTGRDTDEIRAFFEPHDYEYQRGGRHSMLMLPK